MLRTEQECCTMFIRRRIGIDSAVFAVFEYISVDLTLILHSPHCESADLALLRAFGVQFAASSCNSLLRRAIRCIWFVHLALLRHWFGIDLATFDVDIDLALIRQTIHTECTNQCSWINAKSTNPRRIHKSMPNNAESTPNQRRINDSQINAESTPNQRRINAESTPNQRRINAESTPNQRRINAESTPSQRRINAESTPNQRRINAERSCSRV